MVGLKELADNPGERPGCRDLYVLSGRFPPLRGGEGAGVETFRPPRVALSSAPIWAAFVADEKRKRACLKAAESGDLSENAQLTANVRWREPSKAHRIAARVMLRGGWVSPTEARGLWVPYCENPKWVWHETRASEHHRGAAVGYFAPCRRCAFCLAVRASKWKARIRAEILRHPKNWFGTLTFDEPTLAALRLQAAAFGGDQPALARVSYRHVQLYLKRLRFHTGAPLRYFAVAEFGDRTERLHYHLIVHDPTQRLTRRALEEFRTKGKEGKEIIAYLWPCRITHWRLVRSIGAAAYVADYLTKSFDIRPHASAAYGKDLSEREIIPERLSKKTGQENDASRRKGKGEAHL